MWAPASATAAPSQAAIASSRRPAWNASAPVVPPWTPEIIALACRVLGAVGVAEFSLKIGNIGIFRDLLPENLSLEDRSVVIGHLDRLMSIGERSRLLASDASVLDDLKADRMELAKLQAETDYEGPRAVSNRPHLDPEEYAQRLPQEAEATFRHLWQVEDLVPAETAELLLRSSRLRGPAGCRPPTSTGVAGRHSGHPGVR